MWHADILVLAGRIFYTFFSLGMSIVGISVCVGTALLGNRALFPLNAFHIALRN